MNVKEFAYVCLTFELAFELKLIVFLKKFLKNLNRWEADQVGI